MRSNRLWIGVTCGVALALGGRRRGGRRHPDGGRQANFTVSRRAARRSTRPSLEAVAATVARTAWRRSDVPPSDNADDGSSAFERASIAQRMRADNRELARGQKRLWASLAPTGPSPPRADRRTLPTPSRPPHDRPASYGGQLQDHVTALLVERHPLLPGGEPDALAAVTAGVTASDRPRSGWRLHAPRASPCSPTQRRRAGALLIRSAAATAPDGARRRGPAPACSALVRSSSCSRSCAASSTSLWRHSAAR